MINVCLRPPLLLLALSWLALANPAAAADPELDLDTVLSAVAPELTAGTLVRLVRFDMPDQSLDDEIYWRTYRGQTTASVAPVRFMLGQRAVIAPLTQQNPETEQLVTTYPTHGRLNAGHGEHRLEPGAIALHLTDGQWSSAHPAVRIVGDEIHIRCAPVRLLVVDQQGLAQPADLAFSTDRLPLLRQPGRFRQLTMWLPVGARYRSTLGDFTLDGAGQLTADAATLAPGVQVQERELRQQITARTTAADPLHFTHPAPALHLLTHLQRRVYAESEALPLTLLAPRGFAGGAVTVQVRSGDEPPRALGQVEMPQVEQVAFDARLLEIPAGTLGPGTYALTAVGAGMSSAPWAVTIVPWRARSSFFVHTMSCCTDAWPTDDEGLRLLHEAGLEMLTATAHRSLLDVQMATLDAAAARAHPDQPAECFMHRAPNDQLLERLLAHQLRLIDLTVARAANFYNEGLSYHHSYAPSVARMLRRLQVFTQQTGDYPSFLGVNYNWFPHWQGYIEGGVATDAHLPRRNAALAVKLAELGVPDFTQQDRQAYRKLLAADPPAERADLLAQQERALARWTAEYQQSFGVHNQRYNAAVRAVRPGTVTVLYENAGHDGAKRPDQLFADMAAACYESYTDHGDWPMSAGYTTDWARAFAPQQPTWLTTCWGTSAEGKARSLLHALGRGLQGGGVPMQANAGPHELARRGRLLRFVSQFGAIATHSRPDRRVAILLTEAKMALQPHGMYDAHAAYVYLTRLGFPPVLIPEQRLHEPGILAGVELLVLPNLNHPLRDPTHAALDHFAGRKLALGKPYDALAKVRVLDLPLLNIWAEPGFKPTAHAWLWQQFNDVWRAPLAAALADFQLEPNAALDPELGYALTLEARSGDAVRYVVVLADSVGAHSNDFTPRQAVPLTLAGVGWRVRDLVKQVDLPGEVVDGRTRVQVQLLTEPATVLALLRDRPARLRIGAVETVRAGEPMSVAATVLGATGPALGPIPVQVQWLDPAGVLRGQWFTPAGAAVTIPTAVLDQPGQWTLRVQEQLTGQTGAVPVTLVAADEPLLRVLPEVQVIQAAHVRAFAQRAGEKLVIVEETQRDLLPVAQKLVADLQTAGMAARLWMLGPADFDEHPLRWELQPEDEQRLRWIEQGRVIGYRVDQRAYIDKLKQTHVPQRGGYSAIEPRYMVGQDCIVLGDGELATSLAAVSSWGMTPNVPGRGQGRVLVTFSPFMADRMAVALLAHDVEGLTKAAAELVKRVGEAREGGEAETEAEAQALVGASAVGAREGVGSVTPVATPLAGWSPMRLVRDLQVNAAGAAAVLLDDGDTSRAVLLGTAGQAPTVLPSVQRIVRLDEQGRLWHLQREVTALHPGWGIATEGKFTLYRYSPDRRETAALPAYDGSLQLPPGSDAGFAVTPDGATALLSRPGLRLWGKAGETDWRMDHDAAYVRQRFALLYPRMTVSAAFSPDGRFVVSTLDTRPPLTSMIGPLPHPAFVATTMLDLHTGERRWTLSDPGSAGAGESSAFAAHQGFIAVAQQGRRTALLDYLGHALLLDDAGCVLVRQPLSAHDPQATNRLGPVDGVGAAISADGQVAAFAVRGKMAVVHDVTVQVMSMSTVTGIAVLADGSGVVAGLDDGRVRCWTPTGVERWTTSLGGAGVRVAAPAGGGVVAANGDGVVFWLSDAGVITGQVDARSAPAAPAGDQPSRVTLTPPVDYDPPSTVALAQRWLHAQPAAQWEGTGAVQDMAGQRFHAVQEPLELTASAGGEHFVRLVYRRPVDNQELRIITQDEAGTRTFVLDLPTPAYREVCLPLRGKTVRVRLESTGPVWVNAFSLWRFRWPGPNVAYVQPAGKSGGAGGAGGAELTSGGGGGDDLLAELALEEDTVKPGVLKDCKVYWPNTDPDTVRGQFLPSAANPLRMVNGQRWELGQLKPWTQAARHRPAWGGSFTVDFGKPVRLGLVATYDWTTQQSQIARTLAVFSGALQDRRDDPPVLTAVVGNDQFWRLLELEPSTPVRVLGVHAFVSDTEPEGLSEVEAYQR